VFFCSKSSQLGSLGGVCHHQKLLFPRLAGMSVRHRNISENLTRKKKQDDRGIRKLGLRKGVPTNPSPQSDRSHFDPCCDSRKTRHCYKGGGGKGKEEERTCWAWCRPKKVGVMEFGIRTQGTGSPSSTVNTREIKEKKGRDKAN